MDWSLAFRELNLKIKRVCTSEQSRPSREGKPYNWNLLLDDLADLGLSDDDSSTNSDSDDEWDVAQEYLLSDSVN